MFIFNKEEVYIGYSLEELSKVREILSREGIKYEYKVVNHSGRRATRVNFRSAGMNMDYEKQYVVSVKKNDYEKARYLVNSILYP
jgi:hypothetical protein